MSKSFSHFVEVNFDAEKGISTFFQGSLNPKKICEKLIAYFSIPIIPGKTLLFFDEIQSCPEALQALRYFHEKMPDLHLIAAGSLLEFAMSEIPSQGVGRISTLFMYPMTFSEYLIAMGEEALLSIITNAYDKNTPIIEPFHSRLIDYFRTYQLIGGLPEIVDSYIENRNIPYCQKILDDLLTLLQDDFVKYKKRVPIFRIKEVFESIVYQSGCKFKYANINSTSASQALKDSLELLIQSGLAYKIHHSAARGLPLGAQVNPKKFKVILADMGLQQRLLGLNIPQHLLATDFTLMNRGNLAEIFVGLELIGNANPKIREPLYYWHREARESNAEIDYVIQQGGKIIPIEVKASTRGSMRSMRIFIKERGLKRGVRISLENFSAYDSIETMPIYASWVLRKNIAIQLKKEEKG